MVDGTLPAKHYECGSTVNDQSKGKGKKKNYPPCHHCGKMGNPPFKCRRRPDAKCSKCNQFGHEVVICKSKFLQHEDNAQVIEQDEEDQMFVATSFSARSSSECWLINSGCTNHMTYDKTLFKDLKPTKVSKVRIRNSGYILAKGNGTIIISTNLGIKTISNFLYVLDIDQNFLSIS